MERAPLLSDSFLFSVQLLKMIHRTTYTSILLKSQEEAFITVLYGITSVYGRNQFFTEFRIFTRDNGSSFCKFHILWDVLHISRTKKQKKKVMAKCLDTL